MKAAAKAVRDARTVRDWQIWAERRGGTGIKEIARIFAVSTANAYRIYLKIDRRINAMRRHGGFEAILPPSWFTWIGGYYGGD